jgi:predicted lipoprotein with Yx(FWY)xxD motif
MKHRETLLGSLVVAGLLAACGGGAATPSTAAPSSAAAKPSAAASIAASASAAAKPAASAAASASAKPAASAAASAKPAASAAASAKPAASTAASAKPAASGSAAAKPAPSIAAATAVETLKLTDSSLGKVVTDDEGKTMYSFTLATDPASKNAASCTGACLGAWPPVVSTEAPKAPAGLTGTLGIITRTDVNVKQVTYNDMPLYYFVQDKAPGDVKGQGVTGFNGNWQAIKAS